MVCVQHEQAQTMPLGAPFWTGWDRAVTHVERDFGAATRNVQH
jgi:hypothetical protein